MPENGPHSMPGGKDPDVSVSSPDPVAQFLDEALRATEDGRDVSINSWVEKYPELKAEFERAAKTASEISLVRKTIGPTFPGYTIESQIGRGGMGVVYLARQSGLNNRHVAIKVLSKRTVLTPQSFAKFRAEAKALASLRHPHVVTVYDVLEHGDEAACVMEYVDGGSLERLIQALVAQSPVPPRLTDRVRDILDDALGIIQEPTYVIFICKMAIALAQALDAVHRDGLLHRDIKPANVLLRRDGTPLLTDFGLAVDAAGEPLVGSCDATARSRVDFSGTLGYAAPEQLKGRSLGRRSDIFALGATIYHALSLRSPFPGTTTNQVLAQMEAGPISLVTHNPHVPPDLAAIVHKAIASDPFERYATAGELAKDLERLLRLEPVKALRQTRTYMLRKLVARNRAVVALGFIGLGTLILGVVGTSIGYWRANAAMARAQALAITSSRNEYIATIQAAAFALSVNDGRTAKSQLERIDAPRRGWEWRHLNARTDLSVGGIDVPGAAVGEAPLIAFSSDGSTLVAATRATVSMFMTDTWKPRWSTQRTHAAKVDPIAVLPGWEEDVWVVAQNGSVSRFDMQGIETLIVESQGGVAHDAKWSGKNERLLILETKEGNSHIRAVDVTNNSPNVTTQIPAGYGKQLAVETTLNEVLCSGPSGTICHRYPTMERIELPKTAGQTVVASNPAGGYFATSGVEGILIWCTSANSPAQRFAGISKAPQALAWIPGSSGLVCAAGRVLNVWESKSAVLKQVLIGHRADVMYIAASPDTQTLVSVDKDGTVLRWNISPVVPPKMAELAATKTTSRTQNKVSPVFVRGHQVRVASQDSSILEVQFSESEVWRSHQLGGAVNALAVFETEGTLFVHIPDIGIQLLRVLDSSSDEAFEVIHTLDDAPVAVDELVFEGDTLVARGPDTLTRWTTESQTAPVPRSPVHELIAADAEYLDHFGICVHSDGTRMIAGSIGADLRGTFDVGSAHVFSRHPQRGWIQDCELIPSQARALSRSGVAVAIDGEWAAVSFSVDHGDARGRQGAVTLFRLSRGCWQETQTLHCPPDQNTPHFGGQLALHDGILLVGPSTTWDTTPEARPVVIYALRDSRWELMDQILPPQVFTTSGFGNSIDVWKNDIVIAEHLSPQESLSNVGRVHVYSTDAKTVTWKQTLTANDGVEGMKFGFGVSVREGLLAVGAPNSGLRDGVATGKVYLYEKLASGRWELARPLLAPTDSRVRGMGCWVELGDGYVAASSHDAIVSQRDQHGLFVVFPLDSSSQPQIMQPQPLLTASSHFGSHVTWLGDGFAAAANQDARYSPGTGSVWIFPKATFCR